MLIDVINGFDFPGSGSLAAAAELAAPRIAALVERARAARRPVIYVNDNFGRWRSDFRATVAASAAPQMPGSVVSRRLQPQTGDYFVLKPRHSGFFATPLELLLRHLRVKTLVLAGFATNICVAFTATDAHIRGFKLLIPRDCTASNSPTLTRLALEHLEEAVRANTAPERGIVFA